MRRGWMVLGTLVVLAMGLVPPMKMKVYDPYGAEGDRLFGDTTRTETYTSIHVVYRPVWREPPDEVGAGLKVKNVRVAWIWLVFQIVGAGLVFGALVGVRRNGGTDGSVVKESSPSKSSAGDEAG